MDTYKSDLLDTVLKQRQHDLWRTIIQNYEIDNSMNSQIRSWIENNKIEIIASKVRSNKRKRIV